MQIDTTKVKKIIITALISVGIFFFGIYIGSANQSEIEKVTGLSGKESDVIPDTDFAPFWKVWNTLSEKHPEGKDIGNQEKVYSAISGLVSSLDDPYTVFFTPKEAKMFEEDISGNFSGVGMEVGIKDSVLTVIAPLKDTPAFKAGIKSGDKIMKINNASTVDMSVDEAIKLIRGEKGTDVSLTIAREGFKDFKEIKITRDIITVPIIDTELRKDGIFVIRLHSFSANSVKLFRQALQEFSKAKTDRLILDLRGNPGGYLDASVDMASWFLPSGKTIVMEKYSNHEDEEKAYRSYGYNVFSDKLKFVILIDGGSASASEILAGAMQDYGRAILVGEKSFGKGSVQEVVKITSDTLLKVTVAEWLTPNGNSISKVGLTPDYEVKISDIDALTKTDTQMNKAVEILNNWSKNSKAD